MSLVNLVEVRRSHGGNNAYTLHEFKLSPERVIRVDEDLKLQQALSEGQLPKGLDKNHQFSMVTLDAGGSVQIVRVVGSPDIIEEKLFGTQKKILKG